VRRVRPHDDLGGVCPSACAWWRLRVIDAVRPGPADDATEVTAGQLRQVVERIIAAGHRHDGDPDILVVFDAGYDLTDWPGCWPTCRSRCSAGCAVTGSNVFNLAALLGPAAVVAGWIGFHRRVAVLSGVPAVWVALVSLLTVAAVVAPAAVGVTATVSAHDRRPLGSQPAQWRRIGWWRHNPAVAACGSRCSRPAPPR